MNLAFRQVPFSKRKGACRYFSTRFSCFLPTKTYIILLKAQRLHAHCSAFTSQKQPYHILKGLLLACKRAALTRKRLVSILQNLHISLIVNTITKLQNPCVFSDKDSFRENERHFLRGHCQVFSYLQSLSIPPQRERLFFSAGGKRRTGVSFLDINPQKHLFL